ncbi:unnamed protein product [Timema podura]|uniref:NADH dehydrogenase subunit 5 n=1 Tax=Timema podura TaxID=61482 RepID=A0ABN7NQT2_TIMPD|nr:unnamed protein product [Timema podura]
MVGCYTSGKYCTTETRHIRLQGHVAFECAGVHFSGDISHLSICHMCDKNGGTLHITYLRPLLTPFPNPVPATIPHILIAIGAVFGVVLYRMSQLAAFSLTYGVDETSYMIMFIPITCCAHQPGVHLAPQLCK